MAKRPTAYKLYAIPPNATLAASLALAVPAAGQALKNQRAFQHYPLVDPAKAVALEHQVRCRRRWTWMTTMFWERG